MMTGLCFVLFGLLMWWHPELLAYLVSGVFIFFGLGMMATSWQFRRLRKRSASRFINWIIRF